MQVRTDTEATKESVFPEIRGTYTPYVKGGPAASMLRWESASAAQA